LKCNEFIILIADDFNNFSMDVLNKAPAFFQQD